MNHHGASEDSDQTGLNVQVDLSLCWTHKSCFWLCHITVQINPYVTNGLSHPYHLGESIFIIRDIGIIFWFIFFHFFDKKSCKQTE